ncbi:MAG TPA: NADH-quinone oxidoreductase subunit C [Acidimicrobiia bacterium]
MADDLEREQSGAAEEVSVEQQLARTDEAAAADQARADADETDAPPTDEQAAGESRPFDDVEHELLARLERELGDGIVESADAFGMLVVRVKPDSWRRAAEVSKRELECDYLSFIAGIDWQPAPREGDEAGGDTSSPVQPTETTFGVAGSAGRMQVFAHVESTKRHWGVTLKTDVDERDPHVDSWVTTYPGADWHERECWEMFGVAFDGHPSLRHLYLPSEFEGHPLRKDYPLLARIVKPWPGLVDVEAMPGEDAPAAENGEGTGAATAEQADVAQSADAAQENQ